MIFISFIISVSAGVYAGIAAESVVVGLLIWLFGFAVLPNGEQTASRRGGGLLTGLLAGLLLGTWWGGDDG